MNKDLNHLKSTIDHEMVKGKISHNNTIEGQRLPNGIKPLSFLYNTCRSDVMIEISITDNLIMRLLIGGDDGVFRYIPAALSTTMHPDTLAFVALVQRMCSDDGFFVSNQDSMRDLQALIDFYINYLS